MRFFELVPFSVFIAFSLHAAKLSIEVAAPHAILINAETGAVLFEKQAKTKVYPGSTTKIATALAVMKMAGDKLDQMATGDPEILKTLPASVMEVDDQERPFYRLDATGTTIYVMPGEKMSLRDLLYGCWICSGNDAANTLAYHLMGDVDQFVTEVNAMCKTLGCQNTHFTNVHGLYHPDHYTTAYDMAMMMRAALKYPLLKEIMGRETYFRPKTNKQTACERKTNNLLLRKDREFYYKPLIGAKTGYAKKPKHNLVGAATNGERVLVAAVHAAATNQQRYQDIILMFDTAFAEEKVERLLFKIGECKFKKTIPKAASKLFASIIHDFVVHYYPSEEEEIEAKIEWLPLSLPIAQGEQVGVLLARGKSGTLYGQVPIYALDSVHMSFFYSLIKLFTGHIFPLFAGLSLLVIAFVFLTTRRLQNKHQ